MGHAVKLDNMRILQVNNVYDRLSTGKIVADLHREYLSRSYESYVCYARGPKVNQPFVSKFNWEFYAHINKVRAYLTGVLYGGNLISTFLLLCKIKKIKPDIVHLHCINDDSVNIYWLLSFLKKKHIRTVVTAHAEFFHTGTCGYAYECNRWHEGCGRCPHRNSFKTIFDNTHRSWIYMMHAFDGFDKDRLFLTSVSPWLKSRAEQNPHLAIYCNIPVLNGIDTQNFYRRSNSLVDRKMIGLSERPVIMYVTSHFPASAKGGQFVIDLAKMLPDIDFLVLGEKTDCDNLPPNIKLLGRVYERDKMALYYSLSDATILTSRAETFSMPVAESLCCGTPVVGFKAGGPESICIDEYCNFVNYGDVDALRKALLNILSKTFDREEISVKAISKYSKEAMANSYIELYKQLMNQ